MSILADWEIDNLVFNTHMIEPFEATQVRKLDDKRVISYGLSSFGYDLRVADEYKIFFNNGLTILDPKNFDPLACVDSVGLGYCIIPPNSFALARSVEKLIMPPNVTAICVGKSTYARVGLIVNVTPIEASWVGYVTLELSNSTPLPVKVYSNEGICQLIFFQGENCQTSYKDRAGKYDNQGPEITLPRV